MNRLKKASLWLAVLFVSYLLGGFFLITQPLSHYIKTQLLAQTGISLEHKNITFNPLRFVVQLHHIALKDSQGQDFLKANKLTANFNPSHLLWGQFHLSEVALTAPELSVQLDAQGQTERPKLKLPEGSQSDSNIDLFIDNTVINDLNLNLAAPFVSQPIQLINSQAQIQGFNLSDQSAPFELKLLTQQKEQLSITGHYQHNKTLFSAVLNLIQFNSSSLNPWVANPLSLQFSQGHINGQAQIKWSATQNPQMSVAWLEASELSGQWDKQLNFSGVSLRSENIDINPDTQQIKVRNLNLELGVVELLLPWANVTPSHPTPPEWQFELNHMTADQIKLHVIDNRLSSALYGTVEHFKLHQLNKQLIPNALSLNYRQKEGGALVIKSMAESDTLNAQIMIEDWPVTSLNPWLNHLTGIQFVEGEIHAAQSLSWQSNEWQSEGQLSFNQVHILDTQDRTLVNLNQFNVGHVLVQSLPQKIYLDQITSDSAWGQLFSSSKESKNQDQDSNSTEWQVILGMPNTNSNRH